MAIGATGVLAVQNAGADKTVEHRGISPTTLSALRSETTRVAVTPAEQKQFEALVGDYAPDPGTVHRLGRGAQALAWVKLGRICQASDNTAGCMPNLPKPVEFGVGDADLVGDGEPAFVSGLATDDVIAVTATVEDGRSFTTRVIANFYRITLADDVKPWEVTGINADMRDGSRYEEAIDIASR